MRNRGRGEHHIGAGTEFRDDHRPRHGLRFEQRALQPFRLHRRRHHHAGRGIGRRQVLDQPADSHHVGHLAGHHLIPKLGRVARALVFGGEHADQILDAHGLEPAHRAHHDVVSLAAEHAAGHQDQLVAASGAPGVPHRLDARARDMRRIEPGRIDARRHHHDAIPRRAVAIVDQQRDLLADRDDAGTARHHAVVQPLEAVLLAEAFVPGGQERHAGHPGAEECAPRRGAAVGMHDIAAALPHQARQCKGVAQHDRGILAVHVELRVLAACRFDHLREPAAARRHQRFMSGRGKNAHQFDDAGVGRADLQRRDDDQNVEGPGIHAGGGDSSVCGAAQ